MLSATHCRDYFLLVCDFYARTDFNNPFFGEFKIQSNADKHVNRCVYPEYAYIHIDLCSYINSVGFIDWL